MITYEELLAELRANSDESYRSFHKKLLKNDDIQVLGVKVPVLRGIAKRLRADWREVLTFPDEYYEVTFIKCTLVGALPYEEFIVQLDTVLPLLNNWATCDCFTAPCIKKNREAFLPVIEKCFLDEREFIKRYALVALLHDYVEEKYLPVIFSYLLRCKEEKYYVMMAAAWLFAEVLVKFYDAGAEFLKEGKLDREIAKKGIRKACESFRLTKEQKDNLKTLDKLQNM